ncbi:right-handed parallel beta-helix repeat-containing protein [Methanobrevibacter sp. DSM 116169]|uniref:right-handed parallel beta-helix repeat-containing protein n=1 Tax=Methanobrevibacter sp. DSM 116169 TaxID=3242727 RepID=UPI0038FC1496
MNKNRIIIIFFVLALIFSCLNSVLAEDIDNLTIENSENTIKSSTTHVVDGSATNQMGNPTIQIAIDEANAGDTILITGENYVHCHFVVNKQLNIISNVGTVMSTCPSDTAGSDGVGIFYFGEGASGSVLSGFTLINDNSKRGTVDPYSIYIKGNSNVTVTNCNVQTTEGPGIYVNGASNTLIKNSYISNSKNGILVEKSNNIEIYNNTIEKNSISGINIGLNVAGSYINYNTIHANNYYGIFFNSVVNSFVTNNRITDNRDNEVLQRAEKGAGIYVDCNISKMEITGNFISENGNYGIYDSENVDNLVDQTVQVINNNYFVNHAERVVYHMVDGNTGPIYIGSNYYSSEIFCGGTAYSPGVLISKDNHGRRLVISEISQIEKGVYSVSFIRYDTKEIASDLNAVELIFFLNKVGTNPVPSSSDIYKVVEIINGTAIVDFRDIDYLATGNTLTVIGPGIGLIDYTDKANIPVSFLKIDDKDIPSSLGTIIIGSDINRTYGEEIHYTITLTDYLNKPLSNQNIIFKVNGVEYPRLTNNLGVSSLRINLGPGTYIIETRFEGNGDYDPSTKINTIIINDISTNKLGTVLVGMDLIKNYDEEGAYIVNLKNINGNPLSNQNIYFTINGVEYLRESDSNGVAKLNIRLNPGTYSIKAEFRENNHYLYSSVLNNVIVNIPTNKGIITLLNCDDLSQTYGENKDYIVYLTDIEGNPLSNQNIKITINGAEYIRQTDLDGIGKLRIRLGPGTYSISSVYEGNDLYESVAKTSKVIISNPTEKIDANLDFENIERTFGEDKPLTIKITDKNGNPLINQNILITINGVTYERISDDEGIARLTIRLGPDTYSFTINYLGNSYYNSASLTNSITIKANTGAKTSTTLIGEDLTQTYGENQGYIFLLKDNAGNLLANQNVEITVNGVAYYRTTDQNGETSLTIRLQTGTYKITAKYNGNSLYSSSYIENELKVLKKISISNTLSNLQIQNIINSAQKGSILIFTEENYENVELLIENSLNIIGRINTTLNGNLNKNVFTIKSNDVKISNLNIIANNGTGILIENSKNINVIQNNIGNYLDQSEIEDYMDAKELLPGNGIAIKNSENILVENNIINLFNIGTYFEQSKFIILTENTISKNNYGILYGKDVSDTLIQNNDIIDNIGLITMEVVEGPLGYGIYFRDSAVNAEVISNNIYNNYIGIFIDSKNSTGIKIVGNLISESTLEGLVFYANYTFSANAIQPLVENNAIYNNAKGPGLIILGEVSANPAGIYGPGEFNDSLKLKLGSNWYGTNKYTIWSINGTQGPGTICPRISTTLITFNMTYNVATNNYDIICYNKNEIATLLPEFEIHFTLNYLKDKEIEQVVTIKNGVGTLSFNKNNYYDTNNLIEASCGSLKDLNRIYHVIFTYNVPDSEIPI